MVRGSLEWSLWVTGCVRGERDQECWMKWDTKVGHLSRLGTLYVLLGYLVCAGIFL